MLVTKASRRFDHLGVGLLDESADPSKRLAPAIERHPAELAPAQPLPQYRRQLLMSDSAPADRPHIYHHNSPTLDRKMHSVASAEHGVVWAL
jgi:hypothetical protein